MACARETLLRGGLGRTELRQSPSSAADGVASLLLRALPNLLPSPSSFADGLYLDPITQTSSLSAAELSVFRKPEPLRFGISGSDALGGR